MNQSEIRMTTFWYSKDKQARFEALKEEIVFLLIEHSNKVNSYDKAIKIVQQYLQTLILENIEQKEFIKEIADAAGREFVQKVRMSKIQESIKQGKFPFVVSVKQD